MVITQLARLPIASACCVKPETFQRELKAGAGTSFLVYCLLILLSASVCAHPEAVFTLAEGGSSLRQMNSPAFLREEKPAKHIYSHLINLHTSLHPSPGRHAHAPCACACVCIQSLKYVWKARQKGLLLFSMLILSQFIFQDMSL